MTLPADKRPVVVFGGTGALGKEIVAQLEQAGIPVRAPARGDIDIIADGTSLAAFLAQAGPRAVVNCLAMVGLDRCYRAQTQAFEANGLFPVKLAQVGQILGLPVLHFSTESVFPCNINGLIYRESDQPGPETVYGRSKLHGESQMRGGQTPFHVVRLPLLYGPTNRRQTLARLVAELLRGNEVHVALDAYSTPIYTPDAAVFAVNWVAVGAHLPPLVHLTCGQRVSLYDMVVTIAAGIGAKGKIKPALSSRFAGLEAKPLHGGLASDRTACLPYDGAIARYADWIVQNPNGLAEDTSLERA